MKPNEESLDDLLKSMESFDFNMNMDEEISDTASDAVFKISNDNDDSIGDDSRPLSALEKLMAEMKSESLEESIANSKEESEVEDNIEDLLEQAKNSAEDSVKEIDLDIQDDIDMAEIEALLNMSDTNEVVDAQELFSTGEENVSRDIFVEEEEEEVLELDPAELDALLSADNKGNDGKVEKTGEVSTSAVKEKKKNKEKSGGFFKKLFALLMEEIPDEEPVEASTLNLSEENKGILNDLDKEKEKKSKKKDKKEKKEKKGKTEKEQKPKKEKKAKPKKEKKPKEEKIPAKPEKKLPRKKVIVTFAFAFSILAGILIIVLLLPPILSDSVAREAFNQGDYKTSYQEYYGKKLSEEDEKKFQGAKTIMRIQSNLDGYHNYVAINDNVMALHSLLEGVYVKEDVLLKAEHYGVTAQVQKIYQEILDLLNSIYHLTEEEAIQLTQEKSDVVYTKKLNSIAGEEDQALEEEQSLEEESEVITEALEESEEEITEENNQEDLLPEELELLQGGE